MKKFISQLKISPVVFSYIFLTICVLVTLYVWMSAKNNLFQKSKQEFLNQADNIQNSIKHRMDLYISSLYGIQALFAGSETVTREVYIKYITTANIFNRFSGISSFIYAPKVNKKDLVKFEKQTSLELTAKLSTPSAYKVYPQQQKVDYFPISYMVPVSPDKEKAYGFDLSSETLRDTAIQQARDQNLAIATGRIILVATQKPAFIIMLPIYANGLPSGTLAQRRENLAGIIASGFRPEELFPTLLINTDDKKGINFEIFDGSDQNNLTDERLLFSSDQGKYSQDLKYIPKFTVTNTITIAGRPWTLRFISLPEFEHNDSSNKLPIIILLAGLDVSLLLFLIMRFIGISNNRALNLAQEMVKRYREHDKLHSHTRVEPLNNRKAKN